MSTPSTSGKGSSNKRKLTDDDGDEQPKRPCSAFCYYMQAKKTSFVGTNAADRMKLLREQWNGLDARAKAPYEARAAHDANRYRREKDVYDKSRVKRPCNAYIMFVKDFLETKMRNYPSVPDAMRAGAAEWSAMSAVQKAPWKRLSDESARHYKQQKAIKDGRVVRYYLSDAAMEAVARRKKRTASVATAKTKASSKAKAKSVKKSTTGVKNRKTK